MNSMKLKMHCSNSFLNRKNDIKLEQTKIQKSLHAFVYDLSLALRTLVFLLKNKLAPKKILVIFYPARLFLQHKIKQEGHCYLVPCLFDMNTRVTYSQIEI